MHILIADHHQLFRDALISYIERSKLACSVLTATDLPEAKEILSRRGKCDVAIINSLLPGISAPDDITDLIRRWPAIRFILLSSILTAKEVEPMIKCGLWGFFPKTMSGTAILDGLKDIIDGKKYLEAVQKVTAPQFISVQNRSSYFYQPSSGPTAPTSQAPDVSSVGLTSRERDVLNLLVLGLTNREIADKLGIQLVTVKLHMHNLSKKLGARNRTEAALMARQSGLVGNP